MGATPSSILTSLHTTSRQAPPAQPHPCLAPPCKSPARPHGVVEGLGGVAQLAGGTDAIVPEEVDQADCGSRGPWQQRAPFVRAVERRCSYSCKGRPPDIQAIADGRRPRQSQAGLSVADGAPGSKLPWAEPCRAGPASSSTAPASSLPAAVVIATTPCLTGICRLCAQHGGRAGGSGRAFVGLRAKMHLETSGKGG